MKRTRNQVAKKNYRTDALLVRRVPVGDADVIVTLFTEARGIISAVARSARKSSKRIPALEPMHLLRVSLDERDHSDLALIVETTIAHPRLHLVESLGAMEAAGRALRWLRTVVPPSIREPALYATINELLDALNDPLRGHPDAQLATGGLRLLTDIGFALVLDRCVRCGKACPMDAPSCLDPLFGGLVCRNCGGARLVVRPDLRARIEAAVAGDNEAIQNDDARIVIDLVDAVITAHAAPTK